MRIETAIDIAARLHEGQRDRTGAPYIGHCVRVMFGVMGRGWDEDVLVAALLHDAVEDGRATLYELTLMGVPESAVELIEALTHRDGEPYMEYLARVRSAPASKAIKLSDIEDNLDEDRLGKLPAETRDRLFKKYNEAKAFLLASASA